MKNFKSGIALSIALALGLTACATDEFGRQRPLTNTQSGAMIGAAAGAIIGGATAKNKKKGILIGAVGGGLAGAAVGSYMDNQKQDLEKVLAAERASGAIQITKIQDNVIHIVMTDQTAFEVGSAQIKSGFFTTMNKVADVVNRYGKTQLTIIGHTDSTGSAQSNQSLSERRASSVRQHLLQQNVHPERVSAFGKGQTEPRASNATADGRRLNRRVEIYIEPIVAE